MIVLPVPEPSTPQPPRKFQFGLCGLLLFVLIGGPVLGLATKWYLDRPIPGKTYPVIGKVLYSDGTPLQEGAVSFTGTGNRAFNSTGLTDASGSFTLSTFEENDGAVPATYVVIITDYQGIALTLVNPASATPATVKKGGNVFKFTVQKP